MSRTYRVYVYTNTQNGKRYVGVTCTSLAKRAGKDGWHYRGSPYFFDAIQKYGWAAFECQIVQEKLTKEAAAILEKKLIAAYQTLNHEFGYNLHLGGFENRTEDVATRPDRIARIRQTLIAQRSDPATRQLMSERMKKVWANSSQRIHMTTCQRRGKPAGRPAVQIECEETGKLFSTLAEVACIFGIHKATLSKRLVQTEFRLFKPKIGPFCQIHLRRVS